MGFAAGLIGKIGAVFVVTAALGFSAAHATCADPFSLRPPAGSVAFTQTRHLNGVANPLVSRGQARVQNQIINWHVTTPVDILTTIGPNGVTQSVEGGPAQNVGPEGAGFLSGSGLGAVFSGDFNAARAQYDIVNTPGANGWTLRLTPRSEQMRRAIAGIDIGGCSAIDSVSVRQASGDRTDIRFAPTP